ncbi:MAG: LysR family transcriptional regulator [Bacilli bacterium]|nr:LysR family transcriptional regulator [Bacilli bacterium]
MNFNINLNLYKYFYEVAKYNSYTKAAENLMISQPSLSYSIKVLETQLEKKLFQRENNKIKLTSDGEDLYNKLDMIFKQLDDLNNTNDEIKGKVTLGVRSGYATKILPFYINEINKIYPNLEIDYYIARSDKLVNLLENKQIDILIDEEKVNSSECVSLLQQSHEAILFTSMEKAKRIKKDIITLDYLKNQKIGVVKRNYLTKAIKELYPYLDYEIANSTSLLLLKIKTDNIFGFSPKSIISKELKNGEFVELKTDFDIPRSTIYLSYIKRLENKNIRCVVDFFNEHSGKLIN